MVDGLPSALDAKADGSDHDSVESRVNELEAALPVFTKAFTSAEIEITQAGSGTVTHGLGEVPKLVQVLLICKTAGAGYEIGDVIVWGHAIHASDRGVSLLLGTSGIQYKYANTSPPFVAINKTSGNVTGLPATEWRMIIKAWA